MWKSLFQDAFDSALRINYEGSLESAQKSNLGVFQNVSVIYERSVVRSLKSTFRLLFIPYLVIMALSWLGNSKESIAIATLLFSLFAPIFFAAYLLQNPHRHFSGRGRISDFYSRSLDNNSLYALEFGMFGIISKKWSEFSEYEDVDELTVSLTYKKSSMSNLKLRFASLEDKNHYVEILKLKIGTFSGDPTEHGVPRYDLLR